MEWVVGIVLISVIVCVLGLLIYSVVSTSLEIRKKAQPSVDSFFDALHMVAFFKKSSPKSAPDDSPNRK